MRMNALCRSTPLRSAPIPASTAAMHCGTRHGPSGTAGAHAASSCSARFLSASACSRAVTVKNVLKRSSTCVSTQSTNGRRRPRASAAREQSTPSTPTPLTCIGFRPPAPPGCRVLRVPRPPYVQRLPPASAAREQSTVTSTAGWAYSVRTQWVQRTSASSMNCEKSSIALPAAGERRYSTGYSTGTLGYSSNRLACSAAEEGGTPAVPWWYSRGTLRVQQRYHGVLWGYPSGLFKYSSVPLGYSRVA